MDKLDLWERATCLQTSSVACSFSEQQTLALPLHHYIDLKYPMVYSGSDLEIDDVNICTLQGCNYHSTRTCNVRHPAIHHIPIVSYIQSPNIDNLFPSESS